MLLVLTLQYKHNIDFPHFSSLQAQMARRKGNEFSRKF